MQQAISLKEETGSQIKLDLKIGIFKVSAGKAKNMSTL